jgi:uncharacterized membrane protein
MNSFGARQFYYALFYPLSKQFFSVLFKYFTLLFLLVGLLYNHKLMEGEMEMSGVSFYLVSFGLLAMALAAASWVG